ncbi:hydrogen peroxide-dependent heme synthase [Alicyclobacillus tolerans]|uniref:Coproheme decarboxylase n=1 Tax=Alicyclobacillus tolerans TaxID=90970 RepID=A0A1M6K663_9BACL|nr:MULTISPECIES: hydrogen peroxide-dependent heme synthase [Alicyclobacillus]QRF23050.1 heme-dependent peroxidase [Alicyclobacillus sp. TC]SHJ54425.1 chlorite dismutase [Alicyclobacillus montanus]
MSNAPVTLDGWYVLHDFRSIDIARWQAASAAERVNALTGFHSLIQEYERVNESQTGSFGMFRVAGHKADILLLHFRPTIEEMIETKEHLQQTAIASYLEPVHSYLSVVELGGYLAKPGVDVETDPYLQSRLKPAMPDMPYLCFYPMSKKREGQDNWYTLDNEERVRLMRSHGQIGREYANKIKQIISGSMGFDDWEWGVTLFAHDPLEFKKIVQEMRFDEVSAKYAEFGPFWVGKRTDAPTMVQVWRNMPQRMMGRKNFE